MLMRETWRRSLGASVPSSAYAVPTHMFHVHLLTAIQIRIIVDTHAHEKPNKKKKPHRGYAFVVFEREKDMRGKLTPIPLLTRHLSSSLDVPFRMWPSSLPFL